MALTIGTRPLSVLMPGTMPCLFRICTIESPVDAVCVGGGGGRVSGSEQAKNVDPGATPTPSAPHLVERLLEENRARDVVADAGGGDEQLAVGEAVGLGVLHADRVQALQEKRGGGVGARREVSRALPSRPALLLLTLPHVALDSSMARMPLPLVAILFCGG